MGGLSTALSYIPIVKDGLGIITGALSNETNYQDQESSQKQALRQLQQTQALQQKQLQSDVALDRERMALETQANEDSRRDALRRAVARQKAQFGASGVNSGSGSAQAVLLGLFDETQEELARREQLDSLRNRALDLSLSNQNSMNILQRTQLQERQKIGRLSSELDRYTGLANSSLDLFSLKK